jgi:hypothetical protein
MREEQLPFRREKRYLIENGGDNRIKCLTERACEIWSIDSSRYEKDRCLGSMDEREWILRNLKGLFAPLDMERCDGF